MQAAVDGVFGHQSTYSVISLDSSMSRIVDPQESLKMDVVQFYGTS